MTDKKTQTTLDALTGMREILSVGWCQGKFSKNVHGEPVSPSCMTAIEWCLIGAIQKYQTSVGIRLETHEINHVFDTLRTTLELANTKTLVGWNDTPHRTQKQVLELFDKTIERLTHHEL